MSRGSTCPCCFSRDIPGSVQLRNGFRYTPDCPGTPLITMIQIPETFGELVKIRWPFRFPVDLPATCRSVVANTIVILNVGLRDEVGPIRAPFSAKARAVAHPTPADPPVITTASESVSVLM